MNSLCRALTHLSKRTRPQSAMYYSTQKPQAVSLSPPTSLSSTPAASEEVVAEDTSGSPRPTEIPFQPKVANLVNLIGSVQSPVKFLASHDGYWAATIISQKSPSGLPLSIPVIFEGDLAHTAACHLKENDDIYIAGHLSADKMPFNLTSDQDDLQVVAHSLNFVQGSSLVERQFTSHKQEMKPIKSAGAKKALDSSSWSDLFNNPTEWRDFRNDKLKQAVKPKHPDFKHRRDGRALWLSSAPSWVFKELEGFVISGGADMPEKSPGNKDSMASEVESWKDLTENPSKWWDNRSSKPTKRHPDFRNKDSGEALWLNRAPEWALQKLPPQEPAKGCTAA